MKKWVGLKNYVKEKLKTGLFAAAVVSGLSIAVVKDAIVAKLPFLDTASPSRTITHIANRNVVVKWMEGNTRRVIFDMWGWTPETWERIQQNRSNPPDPRHLAEAQAKREAEKKIEESGEGECSYCKEEIVKNERGLWESEFLLEYCTDARDGKHKPKIVWKVADEPI